MVYLAFLYSTLTFSMLLVAPARGAQELLIDERFAVAFLYDNPSSCAGGALHGSGDGALDLGPSGDFSLSLDLTESCPQFGGSGGSVMSTGFYTGSYLLTPEGRLRLEFVGTTPPFIFEDLQLTPDLSVLILAPGELEAADASLAPAFGVGVREAAGASVGLADGKYAVAWISKNSQGSVAASVSPPLVGSVEFGVVEFDGAGGGTADLSSVDFSELGQGAVVSTAGSSVSYSVGAGGAFSMPGRGFGAISPGGRAAFLLRQSGPNPPLSSEGTQSLGVLVKLDDLDYLDRALDGHWVGGEYGIGRFYTSNPADITTFSLESEIIANRRSGSILQAGVDRNVTPFGTNEVVEGGSIGSQHVDESGRVLFAPDSFGVAPVYLGTRRDLAIGAIVEDDFYVSLFMMLRVDGALGTTTRLISQSVGGHAELEFDAGDRNAGSIFLLAGSVSGSYPGFGGIPLNPDAYTTLTLSALGASAPLTGSFGTLDERGRARAAFAIPAGVTGYAGVSFCHAGFVYEPLTGEVGVVSNAVWTTVVP